MASNLVELPRWLLGSGATAAAIAAKMGPHDPVVAEHLAIDAPAPDLLAWAKGVCVKD